MLVLSRFVGETVVIAIGGETIRITISKATFQGKQINAKVRIGFDCSPEVRIDRLEVYQDKIAKGEINVESQ
jgi:sRNA-binding carbon storage regulator CsrA